MSTIRNERSRMSFKNIKNYLSSASYIGTAAIGINSWVKSFYVSEEKEKEAANHISEINKELLEVKGEVKKMAIVSQAIEEINKELLSVKMKFRSLKKYSKILLFIDIAVAITAFIVYLNKVA